MSNAQAVVDSLVRTSVVDNCGKCVNADGVVRDVPREVDLVYAVPAGVKIDPDTVGEVVQVDYDGQRFNAFVVSLMTEGRRNIPGPGELRLVLTGEPLAQSAA